MTWIIAGAIFVWFLWFMLIVGNNKARLLSGELWHEYAVKTMQHGWPWALIYVIYSIAQEILLRWPVPPT